MPYEPGTADPAGAASLVGAVGPADVVGPARCGHTCPVPHPRSQSSPSPCAQLG
jgi:hypothetical protein